MTARRRPVEARRSAHDRALDLAALGCSDDLIMAVTGHSTPAMVAKYAGPARQKVRAIRAQEKRE